MQWAILSFSHKTPPTLFSLHFGVTSFRWARVENAWAPPKIFLSLPPYQTTPFFIFSPIFSPNFSILPKIHPSKHSVSEWVWSQSMLSYGIRAKYQISMAKIWRHAILLLRRKLGIACHRWHGLWQSHRKGRASIYIYIYIYLFIYIYTYIHHAQYRHIKQESKCLHS